MSGPSFQGRETENEKDNTSRFRFLFSVAGGDVQWGVLTSVAWAFLAFGCPLYYGVSLNISMAAMIVNMQNFAS